MKFYDEKDSLINKTENIRWSEFTKNANTIKRLIVSYQF